MRLQFAYYLLFTSFISCYRPNTYGQDQGAIIIKRYLFEPGITMNIDSKILYKNRLSIQEVVELNTREDSSGKSFFTKVLFYTYLDPDKNLCYNYKSFSDTAKFINYYTNMDSTIINGGWNFYSNQKNFYDSLIDLKDTVINRVEYKRIRVDNETKNKKIYSNIYFFRCDRVGLLVNFNKSLSDKIGCSVVRVDTWKENKLITTVEILFLSDQLSKDEIKVFKAWENNAKAKPVNK